VRRKPVHDADEALTFIVDALGLEVRRELLPIPHIP
jgi:hypothetical protein